MKILRKVAYKKFEKCPQKYVFPNYGLITTLETAVYFIISSHEKPFQAGWLNCFKYFF